MMSSRKTATLFAFFAVAALLMIPLAADNSPGEWADADDVVTLTTPSHNISLGAGDTDVFDLILFNKTADPYEVTLEVSGSDGLFAHFDDGRSAISVFLERNGSRVVPLTLEASKYAASGSRDLQISMVCTNTESGIKSTASLTFPVDISSQLASDDQFNKILGEFDNPLPYPLNTPVFTAIISFLLWMGISLLIMGAIFIIVREFFSKDNKKRFDQIRMNVSWLVFLAIVTYGISGALSIGGVDAYYIALSLSIASIVYIILGAIITWRVYKIAIPLLFSRMNEEIGTVDTALVPLFNMLGKITIASVSFAAILAALGFNLVAILTGAGILGLALSLGAQNSLNQFFSGMTLLITRPFREGDLVKMKEHTAILRIKRIGLMSTTFHSWENEEIIVMPNSVVASTVITNMTSKNRAYRILILVGVAHGTDLELAMRLMREVAYEHPNIIKDGTFDTPDTRVIEFAEFDVRLRLTAYVDNVENFGSISAQIRLAIYDKFLENDIKLSVPEMEVHIS
jgi:small-conductance mechanosensitive channel